MAAWRIGHVVRVQSLGAQRGFEPAGCSACDACAHHQVVDAAVHHHLLVIHWRQAFRRGDKTGAHVDQVGPTGHGAGHTPAIADAAAGDDIAIKKLAHSAHKGKRRQEAGMAAGASAHTGQSVGASRHGLLGQSDRDHIGDHQAAVAVHHLDRRLRATQRRHHHRGFEACHQRKVFRQTGVGRVRHQVGAPRADGGCRLRVARLGQAFGDLVHPVGQYRHRTRIRCWKSADDARLAGCQHQLGPRDQEHGRCHDRQTQGKR